jgi:hypothetical protein
LIPSVRLNLVQLVSGAMLAGAIGGGVTYQVLVSNTVTCLAETPAAASPPRSKTFDGPPLDTTHGPRF